MNTVIKRKILTSEMDYIKSDGIQFETKKLAG